MEKYHIEWLGVELTRKCNYNCVHCMKGEPQNVTITPEIIDTVFSQLSGCDNIFFCGGEVLLELDMMEYVLNAIDKYKLATKNLLLSTNGSIRESKAIELLQGFLNGDEERLISLMISEDSYHDMAECWKAYKFYSGINDRLLVNLQRSGHEEDAITADDTLLYMGKAKDYIDNNYELIRKNKTGVRYPEGAFRLHQICIEDNVVKCRILLAANGLIGLDGELDYDTVDRLAMGNVMEKSLDEIFSYHNQTCMFMCDECYNEIICNNIIKFDDTVNPNKFGYDAECRKLYNNVVQYKRIEYVWAVRKRLKLFFSSIPAREIIAVTKVPGIDEWMDLLRKNLSYDSKLEKVFENQFLQYQKQFPLKNNKFIQELALLKSIELMWNYVLDLLLRDVYENSSVYKELKRKEEYRAEIIQQSKFDVCELIKDSYDKNREEE